MVGVDEDFTLMIIGLLFTLPNSFETITAYSPLCCSELKFKIFGVFNMTDERWITRVGSMTILIKSNSFL